MLINEHFCNCVIDKHDVTVLIEESYFNCFALIISDCTSNLALFAWLMDLTFLFMASQTSTMQKILYFLRFKLDFYIQY